jgi:hypothetical protein
MFYQWHTSPDLEILVRVRLPTKLQETAMEERVNLLTLGRIRGGRDEGRPSEDDVAKARLGEQGVPNKAPKPQLLDDDELQNPKPIDSGGHTA